MKKILFVAVIAVAAMSSCKKEYDCDCVSFSTAATEVRTEKGKDAADACDDAENKVLGISDWTCTPVAE